MQDLQKIEQFYQAAFEQFNQRRAAVPPVVIEFYQYVGLRHTIRMREGKVFVRLSDLIKDAPLLIQKSLAQILVAKLLKRPVPKEAAINYKNFVLNPQILKKSQNARRTRARKIVGSAQGAVYDLDKIFKFVNQTYLNDSLAKPILTWSNQKTFRIFGHHDALHETVVISRTLDDAKVPEFVVEFVLYHELLHIKHPTKIINGRQQIHSIAFKLDEQKFSRQEEAEKWLERLAKSKKKQVQKSKN